MRARGTSGPLPWRPWFLFPLPLPFCEGGGVVHLVGDRDLRGWAFGFGLGVLADTGNGSK